jgi:hypothetical protein
MLLAFNPIPLKEWSQGEEIADWEIAVAPRFERKSVEKCGSQFLVTILYQSVN